VTSPQHPQLEQVIQWAKEAGDIARAGHSQKFNVALKGRSDLVTEIDYRCEQHLINAIRSAYPAHAILSEEAGEVNGETGDRWFIDPLDGTVNYAHHIPFYAVCLAWQSGARLQLGVVYDPAHDECFYAERGRGAWLNGERLTVNTTSDLERSLHATAFARQDEQLFQRNMTYFAHLSRHSFGVRRMGCAALELCYVACGRTDAYWEQGINAWDIAAAALIVEEAGAVITGLDGDPDFFKPPYALLASTPLLHPQLVKLFAKMQ